MECTQRLECTQELFGTQSERTCPEQIGFLGICGTKYPVKRGPNKVGRDPQTCNIILNLNSVSRQHAVINILNKKEYMLMDLDSANKTKLNGKTLQPYIPHPLRNGDTVQFGEVFGIFRLLEEDDDLPMTQAMDIPDTPVFNRHVSKLNNILITTVPESPEVSDREESFIVPSQTRDNRFKNSNNHFIKPCSKTISIQPVGTNKIDNVYWSSSKKSTSLNLDNSDCSFSDSVSVNDKVNDSIKKHVNETIHEMETQVPYPSVHDETADSIYTANTQLPSEAQASPSIHSLETQLPVPTNDIELPEVHRIADQQDVQLDLYTSNKENDNSIFNAETQIVPVEKEQNKSIDLKNKQLNDITSKNPNSNDISRESAISDDVLFFEEINSQVIDEDYNSQPLLPPELPHTHMTETTYKIENQVNSEKSPLKQVKRNIRLKSDSSTDCEEFDILPTQKIPEKKDIDDDLTDCEDDIFEADEIKQKPDPSTKDNENIRFEELVTQIIDEDAITVNTINVPKSTDKDIGFEDMLTQVIEEDVVPKSTNDCIEVVDEPSFEELPTQIIEEDLANKNNKIVEMPPEFKSPFKVPLQTPLKVKRKDIKVDTPKEAKLPADNTPNVEILDDDDKYYAATQEIFDDLCTQKEISHDTNVSPKNNVKVAEKSNQSPSTNKNVASDKLSESDHEENVNNFVSGLSSQQIRDVIGVEQQVSKLRKQASDASDCEVTPKKINPFQFMEIELPNSQEIKSSVTLCSRNLVTESSSESENDSEEQFTPILFKKKRTKPEAKIDLTKKFDVESLPTRVITRVRKPTAKLLDKDAQKITSILKPKFLTEQEDEIDKEIINENISRLKNKNEKVKNSKTSNNDNSKVNETKKDNSSSNRKSDPIEHNKTNKSIDKSKEKHRGDKTKSKESKSKHKDEKKTSTKEIKSNVQNKKDESSSSTPYDDNSTRHTRSSRNKQKSDKDNKKVSISPDKVTDHKNDIKEHKTDNRKRTKNIEKRDSSHKEQKETEKVLEKEVRRSKRQRVPKEEKDDTVDEKKVKSTSIDKDKPKSYSRKVKPEKHEQSTVYNISSESGVDSPSLKRPAGSDLRAPSSKRIRSAANATNSSLRSTPARMVKTHHVLFTAFPCEEVKAKLEKLGAIIVNDVTDCTVLLTMHIKRTFKLLCAVGLGRPIVGPNWVQACVDTNMIVDPWLYLIKDEAAEKRYQFSLERTLIGKRSFLAGYNISCTPSVVPSAQELKLIVECSGGSWKEDGAQWICVSCFADKSLWPALKRRGATVVSSEFILGGVLRQKLNIAATKLRD